MDEKKYLDVRGFYRFELKDEKGPFKYIRKLNNYLNDDFTLPISKNEMADALVEVSDIVEELGEETFYQAFMKETGMSNKFETSYLEVVGGEEPETILSKIYEGEYQFEEMQISIYTPNMDVDIQGKKGYFFRGDRKLPADQIWNRIAAKNDEGLDKIDVYTEKVKEIGFRDIEDLLNE